MDKKEQKEFDALNEKIVELQKKDESNIKIIDDLNAENKRLTALLDTLGQERDSMVSENEANAKLIAEMEIDKFPAFQNALRKSFGMEPKKGVKKVDSKKPIHEVNAELVKEGDTIVLTETIDHNHRVDDECTVLRVDSTCVIADTPRASRYKINHSQYRIKK